MKKLLARLDAALRRQRPEYYSTLLPGATPEQIQGLEKSLQMRLPKDLRDLLEWKGGHAKLIRDIGEFDTGDPLYGKYRLMSVEQIQDVTEEMREMLEGDEWDEPGWWNARFIPFAHDLSSDYLLLDMSGPVLGPRGRVMDWAHASPQRIIVCPSLRNLIECVVTALESGLSDPQQDGVRYREILIQQNPGYPFFVGLG